VCSSWHPSARSAARAPGALGRNRPVLVLAANAQIADDAFMQPRKVVIVAFPGVQPLDVAGPAEAFAAAAQLVADSYDVQVVARSPNALITRSGAYGILPA